MPKASLLPDTFRRWFESRGWQPREHQLQLLAKAKAGRSVLLVAPTGAGKTLAGFLPSLVELAEQGASTNGKGSGPSAERKLHTLYISPLKALAVDIARNLETPVREMGLPVRVETRTGDTSAHKRARQIERPPDILLTTPEQLALLLAHREAAELFSGLKRVVLDELHSLVTSKRGDLLSLGLARLHRMAPDLTAVGLSATVREPDELRRYLVPQAPLASEASGPPIPSPLVGEGREGGGASQKRSRSDHHLRVEGDAIREVGAVPPSPTLPHKGGEGRVASEGTVAGSLRVTVPSPEASNAAIPSPLVGEGREGGSASQKRSRSERVLADATQEVGAVPPSPSLPHPKSAVADLGVQELISGTPEISGGEGRLAGGDELAGEGRAAAVDEALADLVVVEGGARPDIQILEVDARLPLAGHTASASMPAIYDLIRRHKTTLVFVNTRLQAEFVFQALWNLNDDGLPIALHHGSLDVGQRRRVEEAMTEGRLKAVVCTATLDLGIDWGDVDLVVNVGAPKGASRIMQRIGRSNHRMDEPSQAYLVPANRFEILECRAALDAVHEAAQDTPDARIGALDVLCQHVLGMACAEPFEIGALYDEVRSAAPYRDLSYEDFEAAVAFVATGGYALRAYERFAKIVKGKDGLWRVRDGRVAQQYRLNVGTIVESPMIKVRIARASKKRPGAVLPRGGRVLGEIEEYFAETMTVGDTFLFAGEVLRFEGIQEDEVLASRTSAGTEPKIPSYAGGKFPLSTFLAERVRQILSDPFEWDRLPPQLTDWLLQQRRRSVVPGPRDLLVETYPRSGRYYLTCFPFEGRLAHQTLGMLLTRRLERARLRPLGFVANDYGLAVWCMSDITAEAGREPGFIEALFDEDMLGDDLEAWLAESALMKRTFRYCAVIAGLIERRFPGQEKTGRQVTISTDLVYDVLRKHEPDHVLLRAARADAATGLLDVKRLGVMLRRIRGRIIHKPLDRVSPLSVSVMLEIGRERVYGESADEILAEAEAMLLDEALG